MAAASLGAGTVDLELWAGVRANQSPVVQAATLQNVMVPVWPIHQIRHTAQLALGMQVAVDQSAPNGVQRHLCSAACLDKAWSGSARAKSMCRAHVVDHVQIQRSIGAVNHARQNNISLSRKAATRRRVSVKRSKWGLVFCGVDGG
jgi:hypothetical protein